MTRKLNHMFNDFLLPQLTEQVFTLEKNTKKAIKEMLLDLEKSMTESHALKKATVSLMVDVSVLDDYDKIAPFVAYAMHTFRNIGHRELVTLKVKLNEELSNRPFTDEDEKTLDTYLKMGGVKDAYITAPIDLIVMANILNIRIDNLNQEFLKVSAEYNEYIEDNQREQSLTNLSAKDFPKKYNFHTYSQDLANIYSNCFNPMLKLLSPSLYCNPNPSFQRNLVWGKEQKVRLITSIMYDYPIGNFYINSSDSTLNTDVNEGYGNLLWDGKQRLHAVHSFIKNEFSVPFNGEEYYYKDMTSFFNYKMMSTQISVIQSKFDNVKELIEAYIDINENSVKHSNEDIVKAKHILQSL